MLELDKNDADRLLALANIGHKAKIAVGWYDVAAPIFVVHFNHDYNEWTVATRNRDDAIAAIADAFEIEESETGRDTAAFWSEVVAMYETCNWKGFTLQTIDPATLKIRNVEGIQK